MSNAIMFFNNSVLLRCLILYFHATLTNASRMYVFTNKFLRFTNFNLLWVQFCNCLWAWLCCEVFILDWFVYFTHQKSQKLAWLFTPHTNTNTCHLIILTILVGSRDVRIPIVVSRLRDKASVHFLNFVTQLRLFLCVVILVIGSHKTPWEQDVFHWVLFLNGSNPKGCQSLEKLDFIIRHITQPSILISY